MAWTRDETCFLFPFAKQMLLVFNLISSFKLRIHQVPINQQLLHLVVTLPISVSPDWDTIRQSWEWILSLIVLGGPHVGHVNNAIWDGIAFTAKSFVQIHINTQHLIIFLASIKCVLFWPWPKNWEVISSPCHYIFTIEPFLSVIKSRLVHMISLGCIFISE